MSSREAPSESRTERRKEETRRKIISVAMELFHSLGFDATTMEQIAEEADIARKTLYNHFPVKEAILEEYVRRLAQDNAGAVPAVMEKLPDTQARLIALLYGGLENVMADLGQELLERYTVYHARNLYQLVKEPGLRSGINDFYAGVFAQGQETGEIRPDIPSEVLATKLRLMHNYTVMSWLADPESFPLLENVTGDVEIFLEGAGNRPENNRQDN